MTPYTQPHFAKGNQITKLLADAKAAGFVCIKLDVMGSAKYRAHFAEERKLKESSCITSHPPIQVESK